LGKTPPWELMCLSHILPIHVEIAKTIYPDVAKGGSKGYQPVTPSGCPRSIVEKSFQRCQYFLQSDYSCMASWDPNKTTDRDSRWRLDCSSIASTAFLAAMTPQETYRPLQQSTQPVSGTSAVTLQETDKPAQPNTQPVSGTADQGIKSKSIGMLTCRSISWDYY
jgi:hypothetical protein